MKLIRTVKNAEYVYPLSIIAQIVSENNILFHRLLRNPMEVGKMNPVAWVVHCTLHY
jgi:hypothetical protein